MIVSHKHGFIFIKTRKTAGTSIEIALSSICGNEDIITPISPKDEIVRVRLGYKSAQNFEKSFFRYSLTEIIQLILKGRRAILPRHMSAKEIKELVGRNKWDSYYKFCFERNPFDKVISLYFWRNRNVKSPISISEYLSSNDLNNSVAYDQYAIDNRIVVDDVFEYEHLSEAIVKISNRLNLKEPLKMPSYKAKSGYRKDNRHYSCLLNEKDKQKIESIFYREIHLMKYKF